MLSGGMLAAMIFIPAFTENVLGIAAEKSGYWMTPLALASGVGAGLGGAFVTRYGPAATVISSGVIAAAGYALFPLWVDARWEFIVSSMIAGAGIGIILGAPLNILATEGLAANKGTALASLPLFRQIGMTIAPTIYAGFIARGFNNMGELFRTDFQDILQDNISRANLSQEALAELTEIGRRMAAESGSFDAGRMNEVIEAIRDPALKEAVLDSVADVTRMAAENGYGGLYAAAAVVSALVIVFTLVLIPLRRKISAAAGSR